MSLDPQLTLPSAGHAPYLLDDSPDHYRAGSSCSQAAPNAADHVPTCLSQAPFRQSVECCPLTRESQPSVRLSTHRKMVGAVVYVRVRRQDAFFGAWVRLG